LAWPRELQSKFQMPRFSRMVPGSAPALGCRRVRLAPDLSKQPPACGRIFFNSAREGACWCTRGRVRSPGHRRCRAIFCGAAASIPVAELGTSFDGAWHGLASCSRNSKCRAFRVGRAHSISRRVRMSEILFFEQLINTNKTEAKILRRSRSPFVKIFATGG
jgi:hypothetical protein